MCEASEIFKKIEGFVYEDAISSAEEIKFDKTHQHHLFVMVLYSTLLEQAWAILTLIHRDSGFHSYPLLRAQLESFADFKILMDSPAHINNLELQEARTVHDRLVAAKSGNPYLNTFEENMNIDQELSKYGNRIKALKKAGATIVAPGKKLDLAGLTAEKEALYGYLCSHTHGGLRALVNRHIQATDDEDFSVVGFRNYDMDEFEAVLQTVFDVVLNATVLLHEHFGTKHAKRYRAILAEMRD